MLQLTDAAVRKAKEFMAIENKDGGGLRVAVKGGGCSEDTVFGRFRKAWTGSKK